MLKLKPGTESHMLDRFERALEDLVDHRVRAHALSPFCGDASARESHRGMTINAELEALAYALRSIPFKSKNAEKAGGLVGYYSLLLDADEHAGRLNFDGHAGLEWMFRGVAARTGLDKFIEELEQRYRACLTEVEKFEHASDQ